MKPASFVFDRRLYELLQEGGPRRLTTRELRDAYAGRLEGADFRLTDLRRYVYEQIRRMLRAGWLVADTEIRTRNQVYHLQPIPEHLQLTLIDKGFEESLRPPKAKISVPFPEVTSEQGGAAALTEQRLEVLHKELRLDFLSAMGEAERYKQISEDMPHLRNKVEQAHMEARDRSSRLLGHLRAVEATLKTVSST